MHSQEAQEIITQRRKELGPRLVILAHHYQDDAIVRQADFLGDSLELARKIPQLKEAEFIVFCGVYFMAETAVILAPEKKVFIPDRAAGCPLADTARIEDLEQAWKVIQNLGRVIPITYVNSSAAVKAFCGRHGGAVCTSGNARRVLAWALGQGERVLFVPDRNLGRNTARALSIADDAMELWDPARPDSVAQAQIILWNGCCPIHAPTFTAADVAAARQTHPGLKVIVHPESDPETVSLSDAAGSTAQIIKYIRERKLGETVAVGTETHMVRRLAEDYHAIVRVLELKESFCEDMARITPMKLAQCLAEFSEENRVRVPEDIIRDARIALNRMLEL